MFCFKKKNYRLDLWNRWKQWNKISSITFQNFANILAMKTRKYLKIFTKDFQSGADKRIRSRKDELTAKCPMINSWCKTVFVPRIFRLSLSALGCKLRVRNWVNYARETNGPTRKRNPVFSSSNIYVARYFSVRG